MSLLTLWDIDGTLLLRATKLHAEALHHALREVHGIDPAGVPVEPAGRTDQEIARQILVGAGVTDRQVEERAHDVQIAACEYYGHHAREDLSGYVAPGVIDVLSELHERDDIVLGLLTGNYEPIARMKLRQAGIGKYFAPHQGAFGSDAEDRTDLPHIARRRAAGVAGPHPREQTVIIGDTPRDIACARADGVRCIGVATGPHMADELAEADEVVGDVRDAAELLRGWV